MPELLRPAGDALFQRIGDEGGNRRAQCRASRRTVVAVPM
jgi:hypothetical protein